jgi:7-cyano-7-deazaguanine synthase in queuosine biosynthesis
MLQESSKKTEQKPNVHLVLWTGGWDSTFRVLYLLLVDKAQVSPVYVKDPARVSTERELQTIASILRELAITHPEAAARVRPLQVFALDEIPPNQEITDSYLRLKETGHFGTQYDWLARLAQHMDWKNVELSVVAEDRFSRFHEGDSHSAFARFDLPVLGMTKLMMADIAKANGFNDLMELTWFCHTPVFGRPCGLCGTCSATRKQGLGRRVPGIHSPFRYVSRAVRLLRRVTNRPGLAS